VFEVKKANLKVMLAKRTFEKLLLPCAGPGSISDPGILVCALRTLSMLVVIPSITFVFIVNPFRGHFTILPTSGNLLAP